MRRASIARLRVVAAALALTVSAALALPARADDIASRHDRAPSGPSGDAPADQSAPEERPGDVLLRPARLPILIPETVALDAVLSALADPAQRCRLGPAPRGALEEIAFSAELAHWMTRAAACRPDTPAISDGAVTREFWRSVFPDSRPPGVVERTEALTLTFEATPFSTPPIWNFCQDIDAPPEARADHVLAGGSCVNRTDPCSMLTWGPRGATAGQGREIQWILKRLDKSNPELLDDAFGAESDAMRRLLTLQPPPVDRCDGSSATEAFLCAVWTTPDRRAAWSRAMHRLGDSPVTRAAYRDVYALFEFDGYKLAEYRTLWESLGLAPSELDFAFFYDRATHIGSPPAPLETFGPDLAACVATETAAATRNAAARRCVARLHPHLGQPKDRLGRDMAYYRSGYPPEALTEKERDTWDRHIPIDAAENLGLSDDRPAPRTAFEADYAAPDDWPNGEDTRLTDIERRCQALIWP